MRLSPNMASLNVYMTYSEALDRQSTALKRISSGIKISTAEDDPGGLAEGERMKMQIAGLQIASQNSQDGVSMLQTAEGGLENITDMVQRVRELVVQSNSGGKTPSDVQNLQHEVDQLIDGVKSTVDCTEFNGKNLLQQGNAVDDPQVKSLMMTIGANAGDSIDIPVYDLSPNKIGDGTYTLDDLKSSGKLSLTDRSNCDKALNVIDKSLESIVSVRSEYGAFENKFEISMKNTTEFADRDQEAQSSLCDADISEEILNYSTQGIIAQASIAIMAQTNKLPQDVLTILENVRGK